MIQLVYVWWYRVKKVKNICANKFNIPNNLQKMVGLLSGLIFRKTIYLKKQQNFSTFPKAYKSNVSNGFAKT